MARIASYELAFRMQAQAPEAVDLASESAETRRLYGLDDPRTERFGRRCLMARRLVERGVRFVQVYSGGGHLDRKLGRARRRQQEPRAALRRDRPADRGPLDRPQAQGPAGRDPGGLDRRVRPDARPARAARDATTARAASPPGWPAAASRAGRRTGRPTISAMRPSKTRSTFTTCTPPSCT